MIVLSHPTGNENVRNACAALNEKNVLHSFFTTIATDLSTTVLKRLPKNLASDLKRRSFSPSLKYKIRTYPNRELLRLLFLKMGMKFLTSPDSALFSPVSVYRDFDSHVAKSLYCLKDLKAVYTYDDCAHDTFSTAKKLGLKCILEFVTSHHSEKIDTLNEEKSINPEWARTMVAIAINSEKVARKEKELDLADLLIVPSVKVKDSLKFSIAPKVPVIIVPFGAPDVLGTRIPRRDKGKLKVIFIGELTQYKGISYLFSALEKVKALAELTVIGPRPATTCCALEEALVKCRYLGCLSREQVLQELSRHDILVQPSLIEGLSLVMLEAISRGLPVIVTPNTGGNDIIKDGHNGFIVPARSSAMIEDRIAFFAKNRDALQEMGLAALNTARHHSWANYRGKLVDTIQTFLKT